MRLALGKNHPIPRLFQVPGPLHLEHAFFRRAEIATAGSLDYWIASCRWSYERYSASGITRNRLFLSYYGTDPAIFTVHEKHKLRKELGIDDKVRLVGMVAFMYAPKWYLRQTRGIKGHEDLIDAISICLEKGLDIAGVFIGGAWNNAIAYEDSVMKYGKKRCGERIFFLGTRMDVPQLYPDFDVAVHPSHSENLGGVVESLLACRPTIATRVGGFPDLVIDGESGWLVPSRRPDLLAKAIIDVLRDPDESLIRARRGQALTQNLLDVKRTGKEIAEIYKTVMKEIEEPAH
ncbi:MAG: glycosyltransferase family 4 protein [bacterium]